MFGINNVQIQRQERDKFSMQAAIDTATMIKLSSTDVSALHDHKPGRSNCHLQMCQPFMITSLDNQC